MVTRDISTKQIGTSSLTNKLFLVEKKLAAVEIAKSFAMSVKKILPTYLTTVP